MGNTSRARTSPYRLSPLLTSTDAPLTQSVYLTYAQIIDARTGAKREAEDDGTGPQARWRLANGSNIVLGANQALVDLTVNSPEQTAILDWQILWELQGRPE